MPRVCEICGKGRSMGNTKRFLRAHYNITGKRTFRPNLQKILIDGHRLWMCVKCIRNRSKVARAQPQT